MNKYIITFRWFSCKCNKQLNGMDGHNYCIKKDYPYPRCTERNCPLLKKLKKVEEGKPINIIFDGPPGHESGRFVEVELDSGKSINAGEWIQKGELWYLRITELPKEEE